jgi:hypothetical protein
MKTGGEEDAIKTSRERNRGQKRIRKEEARIVMKQH